MYFFDLSDYIATARANYVQWSGDTILRGMIGGICGWRGIVGGDFEDTFTTARATSDAWVKALNVYFTTSLDILNEPSGSTINNLYYNDFWNAYENFTIKRKIYFNSFNTIKRLYELTQIDGTFVGTYDDWLQSRINMLDGINTGTTSENYNRPVASGGTVSTPITVNYGGFNDVQYKDEYYDEFKDSMNEFMRIMKTAMVLIDGDTFPDFE